MLRVTVEHLPHKVTSPNDIKIVGIANINNVNEQDGVSELAVQMFEPNRSAVELVQNPNLLGPGVNFTVHHATRDEGWYAMLESVFKFARGVKR
jgi:hypothetical protein